MKILSSEYTLSLVALFALLSACGSESATENVGEVTAKTLPVEVESSAFPVTAMIDPNTATQEDIAAVPGISEAAVDSIIAARPFSTPSEMDAAIGDSLDDAGREMVYAMVFVKVGLNSGANDDYRLIPSTMPAKKLAHEFEEYRPYESLDQFSREMSKYVSDDEAAYLARFVTLD